MDFSNTGWISISGYIWTLSAVTFGILAALAFLALHDTDENTWLARAYQRWRLGRTRMGKLLKRRHFAAAAYVRALPIVEIKEQIARCRACPSTALCDRAVRSLAAGTSRYSFCPNVRTIDRLIAAGMAD